MLAQSHGSSMSASTPRHLRISAVTVVMLFFALVLSADRARADDRVERLARQMLRADDNKVRLSAALNLARAGDARAVPAFARALRDNDDSVRGVAATALGRLVDEDTSRDHRQRVVRALRPVARGDSEDFVRERARNAIRSIRRLPDPPADHPDVYVDVGSISDESGDGGHLRDAMRGRIRSALDGESALGTSWPGGNPSASDLEENGAQAFHVDGTITSLTTNQSGRNTEIACEVSMLIATYPQKSMFGFLDGSARVQTGSSDSQVERGKRDCVVAVADNLVSSRVVPTLEGRIR